MKMFAEQKRNHKKYISIDINLLKAFNQANYSTYSKCNLIEIVNVSSSFHYLRMQQQNIV